MNRTFEPNNGAKKLLKVLNGFECFAEKWQHEEKRKNNFGQRSIGLQSSKDVNS
jgi:hypothetical protein